MNNVLFTGSVIVNNITYVYEVDNTGCIWVVDPKTDTSISFNQYCPIKTRKEAEKAVMEIIANTGVIV